MIARFRRLYGAGPLHLLTLVASLAITGAAIVRWFDAGSDTVKILVWFGGAIVAHDLVLWPLYSLLDLVARRRAARVAGSPSHHWDGWAYVRVPAVISGILFLLFFPSILRLGDRTYHDASGLHQNVFLARYLITVGALFALSALAYAVKPGAGSSAPRAGRTPRTRRRRPSASSRA
jgi:hypothetical protein